MIPEPSYIEYEILDDATCSYCGKEADFSETPDGNLEISDRCYYCDRENMDLRIEFVASRAVKDDRPDSSSPHTPADEPPH